MGDEQAIAALRVRVASLVEREGALVAQAMKANREGAGRRAVDALFAQMQALQMERNSLQKQIAGLLGQPRMHVASEVWKTGVYDYRPLAGRDPVRVRVSQGPMGFQVLLPGQPEPVSISRLDGAFDGPLEVDGPA